MKYRVKSKLTRWYRTFTTLEDAQNHMKNSWDFKDDPTAHIVEITEVKV
jgi:hypothetical protein